jgi:hypothetical protein
METNGASGGPTTQALIRGLFLTVRWLRNSRPPAITLDDPFQLSLLPQLQ